jgi:muconolactone D-isomerase
MNEYLVRIEVDWPPDGDSRLRDQLIEEERIRAQQLVSDGTLRRLWRIPGRWANYGIWRVDDATQLHDAISSLPFYPWLDVTVEALANHPSDPGTTT